MNERAELHKTIWKIANDLRGSVDGWEFKAYVLGTIFYRYISEDICQYVADLQAAAGIKDFDYSKLSDDEAEEARFMLVQEKGYFIKPSHLFQNVVKDADRNEYLNSTLFHIFREIEDSAVGTPSENDIKGLFSDFVVDNTKLAPTVALRNRLLSRVLHAVNDMNLKRNLSDNDNDTFGEAYEFLMKMYASQAGKSGGEFFTPQEVSELLAEIAAMGTTDIKRVYDPCCGSGSLLLKFKKIHGRKLKNLMFYGQEINPTTYNLCRINMFLHHVNYNDFDIQLGDTLLTPKHRGMKFDCIVSNPPYSLKWDGKENPILYNDERFADAGVLAPQNAADLAFVLHMYNHLQQTGACAIVEFPGVLYRGGAEKKIRQYLLKINAIDTIIQLPPNLFFGVGIATCIIVLKKDARRNGDNHVLFIDATKDCVKDGNKNRLTGDNQKDILTLYENREDVQYKSKLVSVDDILANDANLSVSSYVEQEDTREKIIISEVNEKLRTLVKEGIGLNEKIEAIIKELGE